MRVLLTTRGSRGDVEPLAGLAVALRELGTEATVCAPPDEEFAVPLERVDVPLVPLGPTVRSVVAGPKPPTAQDAFRLAPALVAARFEVPGAAARGCDALPATGLMPAGARDVAEKQGIPYVLACFHLLGLPSRHFAPGARPGTPSPEGETDHRVLWEQDAQRVNALYGEALDSHRAAISLPPVDNVRDHVLTGRPWPAADPVLCPSQGMTELDVVQTGAWILTDDRPGLGGPGRDRRRRRLLHRRRGQPAGAVPPGGGGRAPRRRGHHDDGGPSRCAPGDRAPDRGPAVLGGSRGGVGRRRGARGLDVGR
ncbi:Glycosyltransferase, family 1 [Saccharothrix espanaensis DSM 44229]|uniref:Glycosyltransferase, family 1 n=1 Tax=Saccharothrix espanaensis (strain ATCC 51144 / DSM 44229 / JCM 9112 / NBRC 15066 / NRRL 15764) TaxID=1179773 RepID=K0JV41_SACES|nr:Glycosyltransferase, family 1 [Saccharothrix espanaensis DSM 44229]